MKTLKTVLLATAFAFVSATALAHHSPEGFVDTHKTVEMKGVLTGVEFVNPHVHLHLAVKDANGKLVYWTFEAVPPGWFRRAGIKQSDFTAAIGSEVTITGSPARDGSTYGSMQKLTLADGRTVSMGFGPAPAPGRVE